MHFNKLDLNLLVAFDALSKELNITRAAARLHMSQSAMSHALRRLRTYFDDELLLQVGRKMELTPRARMLQETVSELLAKLEISLSAEPEFLSSDSDRTFTIFASDYSMQVLLPTMMMLAARQNSRVKFRIQPQINHPDHPLNRGEADLMLIPQIYCSPRHPSISLLTEKLVCVMWAGSPLTQEPLTVEKYIQAGHVVMIPPDTDTPAFENAITQRLGTARQIQVTTFSFSAMPGLVLGTNNIATMQWRLAKIVCAGLPVVIRELPLNLPPLVQAMQWHRYRTDDAGLIWLRRLLQQAVDLIGKEHQGEP